MSVPSSLPHITLSAEQAAAVRTAQGMPIELRAPSGERLGLASILNDQDCEGCSAEEVARAQARFANSGLHYSTEQIASKLRLLRSGLTAEEIRRAKQALTSNQPRYSTEQVLERLRSLESS